MAFNTTQLQCDACVCYFTDWLSQDLHPNHILFNHMHRKNLAKAMPAIIPYMYRFITSLQDDVKNNIYFLLNQNLLSITAEEPTRTSFMWFKMKQISYLCTDGQDIGAIQAIMEDAFICEGIYIDQWIGYCLINLLDCVKDMHMDHSGASRMLELLQDNGFSSASEAVAKDAPKEDNPYVIMFDDLYS